MAKTQVIKWKFWGLEFDEYPNEFTRGAIMLIIIVSFPFWIWPYLGYKIVGAIGTLNGKPRKIARYEEEEEKTYY